MLSSPFLVFLVFRFVEDLGKYDDPDLLSKIFSIQKEKPSICIANPYLYCMSWCQQDDGSRPLPPSRHWSKAAEYQLRGHFPQSERTGLEQYWMSSF